MTSGCCPALSLCFFVRVVTSRKTMQARILLPRFGHEDGDVLNDLEDWCRWLTGTKPAGPGAGAAVAGEIPESAVVRQQNRSVCWNKERK